MLTVMGLSLEVYYSVNYSMGVWRKLYIVQWDSMISPLDALLHYYGTGGISRYKVNISYMGEINGEA